MKVTYQICCGVDVRKSFLVATIVKTTGGIESSYQKKRFSTFNNSILEFKQWLLDNDCHDACMESTGKYWVPVFNLLEEVLKVARKYDHEFKVQAVKLAKEIGGDKAAKELGIPEGTVHTWLKAVRNGKLDIGVGAHTPASAMSLTEEITMLRKRVKDQDKEIRRLKEENEFLEEAKRDYKS